MFHLKDRLWAAGIHFGISAGVALLAALLVFGFWYPWPYREISGGRELFLIVVAVDVILGPLITFAIFSRSKPRREMRLDFAVIGLIQLAGLAYGLWTVFLARPVHLAFEYDRFRVVHAVDVPVDLLGRAPVAYQTLPLGGPTLVSLRPFASEAEKLEMTVAALNGVTLGARPELWRDYAAARADVLKTAKPLDVLDKRFPAASAQIAEAVRASGKPASALAWVPMIGRKSFWTVLVDRQSADIAGFLPLDSF